MKRNLFFALALTFLLASCQTRTPEADMTPSGGTRGKGMDSGMMERHRASIPDEYAGLTNPVAADEASLNRGGEIYATRCASCHGDGGMGDGPAGQALNPPAAPIAHTSQMLGDDYLFWRISEGGAPFGSAMPAWAGSLSEEDIWDVINYTRALGQGQAQPSGGMGARNDPAAQATQQADVLAQAVSQDVISSEEADTFSFVHAALDDYLTANPGTGNARERQEAGLAKLVAAGTITQSQANTFLDVHDRLLEAGLMR